MTKVSWVAVAGLVLALAATSVMYALTPAPGGSAQGAVATPVQVAQARRGERPRMSEADRAKMQEQMLERMLEQAGLTDDEKAAAKKAMKAKNDARQALAQKLGDLRGVADNPDATDQQLRDALAAYRAAMTEYRQKATAQDQALAAQLSLRSQARCIALGILDNGLGGMRPQGMGAGMRGPGGWGGPPPPPPPPS